MEEIMNSENTKTVTKYTSASTLALTELWLRKEAKAGWKLIDVKEGAFSSKYIFIKSKSCDEVYFGNVGFGEKEKNLRNTEASILSYLKNKYHLKRLNNQKWCFWHKIKREHITDISDVKINMLIREKCISKSYNTYLLICGIIGTLSFLMPLLSDPHNIYTYVFPVFFSIMFIFFLIKKLNHNRNVKTAYKNFLEE
jgi:hypothetical protein